jgi:hypothetical protein
MKIQTALTLSVATLSLGLLIPQSAMAHPASPGAQDSTAGQGSAPRGTHEAMEMVSAHAALDSSIDAKKATAGQTFEARLANKVRLKNGPTLPAGTALVGKVGTDDMQMNGMSKLALRFTKAELKSGQIIPIKATIVGVYGPNSGAPTGYPVAAGDQVPSSWNDGTLQVDQLNAMSGVDLHSKISSRNSGELISTKKDDIKLTAGTEFGLAIAESNKAQQNDAQQSAGGL